MAKGPGTIGKVTVTQREPSTSTRASFWLKDGLLIHPFDLVRMTHVSRTGYTDLSYTYAIVQELRHITDSDGHLSNYVASDFGDVSVTPLNRRLGVTVAEAEILYNTQNLEMPVYEGSEVNWADTEGIKDALGLRGQQHPIPAGYLSMSNGTEVPVELDARYIIGPEGAHLNISGMSGLATKTSYAMFLMNSVQQRLGDQVTFIVFNVKGNDLLAIDEDDHEIPDTDREVRDSAWAKCGLAAKPFDNVVYLHPYDPRRRPLHNQSHVPGDVLGSQAKNGTAWNYYYDVETGKNRLALLFSDLDDPNATMESMVHQIGEMDASSWDTFRSQILERTRRGSDKAGEISVMSWRRFYRLLRTRTENGIFSEKSPVSPETKRQKLMRDAIIENLKPGRVIVVDIEPLPDFLQCLVFGDVMQTVYEAKLGDFEDEGFDTDELGQVVVFADELNKYAPKGRQDARTLTRTLLEISERGRSLGIILFGAQQFRSGVHERVLGNCSTNVYGRTTPVEIAKCPDYGYFPAAYKSALTRLSQGDLLVQHAAFRTALIRIKFPRPCYRRLGNLK